MTTIRSLSFDLLYIIQDYAFGLEYKIKPIFKPYVYPPSMLGNPLVIGYAKERLGSYNESAENEEEIANDIYYFSLNKHSDMFKVIHPYVDKFKSVLNRKDKLSQVVENILTISKDPNVVTWAKNKYRMIYDIYFLHDNTLRYDIVQDDIDFVPCDGQPHIIDKRTGIRLGLHYFFKGPRECVLNFVTEHLSHFLDDPYSVRLGYICDSPYAVELLKLLDVIPRYSNLIYHLCLNNGEGVLDYLLENYPSHLTEDHFRKALLSNSNKEVIEYTKSFLYPVPTSIKELEEHISYLYDNMVSFSRMGKLDSSALLEPILYDYLCVYLKSVRTPPEPIISRLCICSVPTIVELLKTRPDCIDPFWISENPSDEALQILENNLSLVEPLHLVKNKNEKAALIAEKYIKERHPDTLEFSGRFENNLLFKSKHVLEIDYEQSKARIQQWCSVIPSLSYKGKFSKSMTIRLMKQCKGWVTLLILPNSEHITCIYKSLSDAINAKNYLVGLGLKTPELTVSYL